MMPPPPPFGLLDPECRSSLLPLLPPPPTGGDGHLDDDDDDGGMGRRAERAHYYACLRRRRVRSALGQVRDAVRGGGGSGSDEEEEDAAAAAAAAAARAEDANSCPPLSDPAALWTALEGRAAVIRPDGTLAVRPPSGRRCDLIVLGAAAEAEADGAAAHAAAAAALGRELAGGGFGFGFGFGGGGGGTAGSSPPPAPLGRDLARRAGALVAREACGRDAASQSVPEAASGPAPSAGSRLWAAAAGLAAGLGRAAADALAGEDERELRVLAGGGGGGGWDASSSAAAAAAAAAADTDDLLTGGAGEGSAAAAAAAAAACGADDDLLTGGAPATAAGTVAPPGNAPILSVALAGECANLLLSYAGEELAGVRGGDDPGESPGAAAAAAAAGGGGGGAALLVHRHGTGPGTLRSLARDAAAAVLAGLAPEGYASLTPLSDEVGQARAETLARLPPADLDLVLLALVRCGGAVLAGEDGDVAALLPGQGLEGEGAGGGGEGLGEVDVAVFRLRSAVASLERRAERLEAEAAVAGERARAAVAAAARAAHPGGGRGGERPSSSSLALAHLRRRSLLRSEAERAAAGLLNVEGALRSLLRARSDAELVRCYQIAGEAMRAARRSREEGGLGLSLAEAEGLVEDLAEEAGELDAIGAALGGAAAAAAGGEENEDDEVDEDLLRELEELVLEGDPPGDDVPAGMREIARARPDAGPEEDKAAVGKAAEDKAAEEQKRTPVLC